MAVLTRGERFKDARNVFNKHGKQTMAEVEKATGIYKSNIQALENDEIDRDVGYSKVAKLAAHYGVSVDYLLGFTNDPYLQKSAIDDLGVTSTVADMFVWAKTRSCADYDLSGIYNDILSNAEVWDFLRLLYDYKVAVKVDSICNNLIQDKEDYFADENLLSKELIAKADEYRETDVTMSDFLYAKARLVNLDVDDSMLFLGMNHLELSEIYQLRINMKVAELFADLRREEENGID